MNKVIHKSFFKRGTAILLALICLISAICLVPINAASREVTITFDYAYDTGGNIIGFVQYTEHDGYVVGTAGEELCTIQADGDDAYCIEPGHSLYSGNTLTTDASAAWNALSKAQKKAVNLALLFGKSGNGAGLGSPFFSESPATALVWAERKVRNGSQLSSLSGSFARAAAMLQPLSSRTQSLSTVSLRATATPALSPTTTRLSLNSTTTM